MNIKQILLSVLFMLSANSIYAWVHDFEADGVLYSIISASDRTCQVVRGDYSGDIKIPDSVLYNGRYLKVIRIQSEAFLGCKKLISVTIPNTITSIEEGTFQFCQRLASVTIPNSVTSIGEEAFFGCDSLASITIPNSVTSIGGEAFRGCNNLVSIDIPNSVTSIGELAFTGCSKLVSVTISDQVTSIERATFAHCSSLMSVTIPKSVKSIGESAFYECTSLVSVIMSDGVTKIGAEAFKSCNNLVSISLPNSITNIGEQAFYECSHLASVTIPNSLTSIENETFYYCWRLSSVTIPNSVTSIKGRAFGNCYELKEVTIPSSVAEIQDNIRGGESSFYGCHPVVCMFGCSGKNASTIPRDSLKKIILMEDVKDFSDYYFDGTYTGVANLDTLVSMAAVPPAIAHVSENQKTSYKVFVPKGTLAAYQAADVWKEFWNLQEGDGTTGINPVSSHSATAKEIGRYTISGEKTNGKVPGINIIRMSDGTTRKVIVK